MPRYYLTLIVFILLVIPSSIVSYWYKDWPYSINLFILHFAVSFGISNLSKLRKHYKYFWGYLLLIYLSEIVSAFLAYYFKNNMYVSHVVIPLQIILISFVFFGILGHGKSSRVYWIVSISIFVMFLMGSSLHQGIEQFSTIGIIIFSFFVITAALFTLKKMTLSSSTLKLNEHPDFWISLGGLVFYSITFFVYAYLWIPEVKPEWTYILIIYSNIFMSLCYLLSLLNETKLNNEI